MNVELRTVGEDSFCAFHEELKRAGCRILRCVEISGRGKFGQKLYSLVWVGQ